MYCIFLKFTVRLAVQSACSTYLFIVLRELCCTLCSVYGLFLAMFGFTMSSVRLILSVNGCKSIQKLLISYVLVCVSKWRCLNYICIVRVQFSSSLSFSLNFCVCIVSFLLVCIWLVQRLYAKYNFNPVGCHFLCTFTYTRTLNAHIKMPLQMRHFLQINAQHFSMCTLRVWVCVRFFCAKPIHVCSCREYFEC